MRLLPVLLLVVAIPAMAADRPAFDPRIGDQLDLRLRFSDAADGQKRLSAIMGDKPAILILGYFNCPNLCGVTQRAVASALKRAGLAPQDYRALFVSIDAKETAADGDAARKRLAAVTDEAGLSAWRFLASGRGNGAKLASQAGMEFEPRERIDEFVHPIAVLVLTSDGSIARVLPATTFTPRDLRLAVVEASAGRLGTISDRIFLLCAGFDESKGQYTSRIWAAIRVGGIASMMALAVAIAFLSRKKWT